MSRVAVQLNERFDALAQINSKNIELPPNLSIAFYIASKRLEKHAVWNMFVTWMVEAARKLDSGHSHVNSVMTEDELTTVAKS